MITEEQNKELISFLLSKKLPLDIMAELYDHMLSQIHEYQKQDLSFEEALSKVKSTWKKDLEVKLDIYFGWNEAKIVKKIYWHSLYPIYAKSFIIGLLLSAFIIWGISTYTENTYFWLAIIGFYAILYGAVCYLYFGKYKRYFNIRKKYKKYKLSVYNMMSLLPLLGSLPSMLISLHSFLTRVSEKSTNLDLIFFILGILLFVIFNILLIAFFLSISKFKNVMDKKVKPFLQYLS